MSRLEKFSSTRRVPCSRKGTDPARYWRAARFPADPDHRNRDLVATLQKVAKVQFVNDGDS
jgi:hypothetical protein